MRTGPQDTFKLCIQLLKACLSKSGAYGCIVSTSEEQDSDFYNFDETGFYDEDHLD